MLGRRGQESLDYAGRQMVTYVENAVLWAMPQPALLLRFLGQILFFIGGTSDERT